MGKATFLLPSLVPPVYVFLSLPFHFIVTKAQCLHSFAFSSRCLINFLGPLSMPNDGPPLVVLHVWFLDLFKGNYILLFLIWSMPTSLSSLVKIPRSLTQRGDMKTSCVLLFLFVIPQAFSFLTAAAPAPLPQDLGSGNSQRPFDQVRGAWRFNFLLSFVWVLFFCGPVFSSRLSQVLRKGVVVRKKRSRYGGRLIRVVDTPSPLGRQALLWTSIFASVALLS